MSASDARRRRRLEAHEVSRFTCRFCGRLVFMWKAKDKVSHQTPICDGFREAFARVCGERGLTTWDGETYPALVLDPERLQGKGPSN